MVGQPMPTILLFFIHVSFLFYLRYNNRDRMSHLSVAGRSRTCGRRAVVAGGQEREARPHEEGRKGDGRVWRPEAIGGGFGVCVHP